MVRTGLEPASVDWRCEHGLQRAQVNRVPCAEPMAPIAAICTGKCNKFSPSLLPLWLVDYLSGAADTLANIPGKLEQVLQKERQKFEDRLRQQTKPMSSRSSNLGILVAPLAETGCGAAEVVQLSE